MNGRDEQRESPFPGGRRWRRIDRYGREATYPLTDDGGNKLTMVSERCQFR
jgi:hypothetical protein